MPERTIKRPAGVTRHATPIVRVQGLPSLSLTSLSRAALERIAADLGLSTSGTDSDLRQRIHLALSVEAGYVDTYQEVYG